MTHLKRIEGNLPSPQSSEKPSPKVGKSSFLGRAVGWFSSKDDSKLVKVAKIALAIFLAAVLAGTVIGIIPLVLAIREWKKAPLTLDRASIADPLPKKDEKLVVEDRQPKSLTGKIEIFVEKFLHPITREITPQTEEKNECPMMDLLLEHLGSVDGNQRKEIEELALKAYLEKSVMGNIPAPIWKSINIDLPKAVLRDFPGLELTSQQLKDRVDQAIVKVIEIFVEKFLHDYITRKIAPQTEDVNREPMMALLLKHLGEVNEIERNVIENAALKAYIEMGVKGYYVHLATLDPLNKEMRSQLNNINLLPEDGIWKYLRKALCEAIPKDFPNLELTSQQLIDQVKQAIVKVNELRTTAKAA